MRIQETAHHTALSPRHIRARVHQCVIPAYLVRAAHSLTMAFMITVQPSALPLEEKRAAWSVLHNDSSCARTHAQPSALPSILCMHMSGKGGSGPKLTCIVNTYCCTCRGRPWPARVEQHRVGREGGGQRRGPHGRNQLRARAAQHPEVPALAAPRQHNLYMDRSARTWLTIRLMPAASLRIAKTGPATAPRTCLCAHCSCGRQLLPSASRLLNVHGEQIVMLPKLVRLARRDQSISRGPRGAPWPASRGGTSRTLCAAWSSRGGSARAGPAPR